MSESPVARRRDILAALGAAAVGVSVDAHAQSGGASRPIWSANYTAQKGAVPIQLYRKRANPPRTGASAAPVLLLCHGSSFSAKTSFDLTVPGAGEYSIMNIFARQGFDVWTLDFEGYGRSGSSGGNSNLEDSLADLGVTTDLIKRETGLGRYHFWGQSSGALRAGAFAMNFPDRVDRLILEAPTWTGEGSPTLIERRKNVAAYRANPRRLRDAAAIRNVFTRDHVEATDLRVMDAVLAAELPMGDTVPSGTYLDMTTRLPVVDPKRVQAPVLIARGEWDGIATDDDVLGFFRLLPNADRMYLNVAGAGHGLALSVKRDVMFRAVTAFLSSPAVASKT
jgi:pimeloyl-ACP methyl ester carboxylesterase